MERNTLTTTNSKNQMVKEYWNRKSQISCGGDNYMNGFSWPPRSYTCSFCKREFRSAQALGGHMNVHRRDRARLRQSPPPTPTQETHHSTMLNPTSGSDFSTSIMPFLPSSSSSTMLKKPFSSGTTFPYLVSPTLASSSSSCDMKKWVVDGIMWNPSSTKASESTKMKNVASFAQEDGCKAVKNADIIRLDLHIGLVSDSKDDLDLELRLGTYA